MLHEDNVQIHKMEIKLIYTETVPLEFYHQALVANVVNARQWGKYPGSQVWWLWYVELVHALKLVAFIATKFGSFDISKFMLLTIS